MNNQQLAVLLRRYSSKLREVAEQIESSLPEECREDIEISPPFLGLGSSKIISNYPIINPLYDVIDGIERDIDDLLNSTSVKDVK